MTDRNAAAGIRPAAAADDHRSSTSAAPRRGLAAPAAAGRPLERPVDELAPRRRRDVGPISRPPAPVGAGSLRRMLGGRGSLRRLMALREILGPPKALG